VSQQREELPREAWHDFFEDVTKEHEPSDVTVEVLGLDLGDQLEAEKLPLAYLEYDPKDDEFIVGVGGRDGRYPVVLDHAVHGPQKILVDNRVPALVTAVEVADGDGQQTIVTLQSRPELPG
jgi:peptidoglycan hydrolase-like protein with peptidoglycan-binding domain